MTTIVDGNKIAAEILEKLKLKIEQLDFRPRLAVFLVGEQGASLSYVKIKGRKAEEIGIEFDLRKYPENVFQEKLKQDISSASKQDDMAGILVQLPLPAHLNRDEILNSIAPELDVDCLTTVNKQRLKEGKDIKFVPPAAAAALKILEYHQIELAGKNVVLVGQGDLIGKPLAYLLANQGIKYSVVDINTPNPDSITKTADVLISGVGKAGLITGEKIKNGTVVIDAGTTGSDEGKVLGDVDFDSVAAKASLISPVPGGVGPLTVAMLLSNVVDAAI